MLDTIPAWLADELTPWGIVFIIILLILTGGLHTNRAMKSMESEKEYWRSAHDIQQKTNQKLTDSISKQEVTTESFKKFISELQDFHRQSGGDDSA